MKASLTGLGALLICIALAGCNGGHDQGARASANTGGSGGGSAASTFSIAGNVSGLQAGVQLSLLDNGSNAQTVSNGPFSLTAIVPVGSAFSISLQTQPEGYRCDVSNGSGTMPASNVTDVAVSCTRITAAVGGAINGLVSDGLVLANGNDTLKVPATTDTFTMPIPVGSGDAYDIVVRRSPAAMRCAVSNGSGTGSSSPVTNVSVSCAPAAVTQLYSFVDSPDGAIPAGNLVQGTDGNFYGTTASGGMNNRGTVFMLTRAGVHTVLWSFGASESDGRGPSAGLIRGTDGNFYGTTYSGGEYGSGTVFKITPSGEETVLWTFGGNAYDGMTPGAALFQSTDGNFYGTTVAGGTRGFGTIFRLTPDGAETVMVSFDSDIAFRDTVRNGLVQGSDGSLYGVTSGNDGAIFKMTLDGTLSTVWSFGGSNPARPVGRLLLASDGNFYGVTQLGGGYGTVFRMTPSGGVSTLYSFAGAEDGTMPNGGLIEGSDGNLYGLTVYGGAADNGTLFRVTPNGTKTTLYEFPAASTGVDYQWPCDSLFEADDGSLYGVTQYGGADGKGSVFQLN